MAKNKLKLNFKNVFALLGILGLGIVILLNRHDFSQFWHLLGSLRWYVVAIVIVVQLASYWVNGLYYRSILRIFSYDVGINRLFEGALATNFVNYVVPSVGLAGAGYLSQVLSPEVPRGESVLTQLMRYALSALAVLIMMPVGFIIIYLSGYSGHAVVHVTLYSAVGIIVLAFALVALVQRQQLARKLVKWLVSVIKRFKKSFHTDDKIEHFVNEFYVGWQSLLSHKKQMLVPFGWSIIYIIIEIMTFYMAFLAFGKIENLGIVIMAYLFANIASIFGGVFFSTGTFELGMAGTLVALGTPLILAVSVTIVYRVLNLIIGLPLGFYYYRKYLP